MNETDFIKKWEQERPMYEAWGRFVCDQIRREVAEKIAPTSISMFLRLPAVPRSKENGSILDKAFYRGKEYADPYVSITDKIGLRFVVLLNSDLIVIENAIKSNVQWKASKDKDFQEQQEKFPDVFEYQSVHYVVKSVSNIRIGEQIVNEGTPCEIQIRTLLQHAHSELTHDTIYKPSVIATPAMKRAAAKSMALIEATNDYFEQVMKLVKDGTVASRTLSDQLAELYAKAVGRPAERTKADAFILQSYENVTPDDILAKIEAFVREKSHVGKLIAKRAVDHHLFRLPSILLVYFLADTRPNDTQAGWPLTRDDLAPIYADLGQAFDI